MEGQEHNQDPQDAIILSTNANGRRVILSVIIACEPRPGNALPHFSALVVGCDSGRERL